MEAVVQLVGGVPEPLAVADLDRGDGDVHLVDQVGLEELTNGGHASTDADVGALTIGRAYLNRC